MEEPPGGNEGGQEDWVLQSPLHVAAYSGDIERLKEALKESDVDEIDENGRTALMYVAMVDQVECLQLLISRGATISVQDNSGQTAIHWSSATGNYKSLKVLLQSSQISDLIIKDNDGRSPLHLTTNHASSKCLHAIVRKLKAVHLNEVDSEGMTALHWSAYNNTPENVSILLKSGADIVIMDIDGKTALHWTSNNPDDTTVKTLLDLAPTAINLKDREGRTAIHLAVAAGNVPVIDALCAATGIKCDVSAVDMQFRTPLHWASVLGLTEVVGVLMEHGADANLTDSVGATALHYAAQKNHVDGVTALLSFPHVRDLPDSEGRTAMMWAAQRGNYNVLKALLEREGDVHACDKLGATALHAASLSGHASCVQLLLQHSANLDAIDSNGHTPLFRACERGHTEVVLVLGHAGASVELRDSNGRTCLHWAASGGHAGICSSLLHRGLPVDSVDNGGRTALHCAAYGGFTECLNVLLTEGGGADINFQDVEGITALHWACSAGHMEAVDLLLRGNANPNMMEVDNERLTPLDYAIIGGHQEVAQVLIEQGALSISSIGELAATMIQKCYRGYASRKRTAPMLQELRAFREQMARPISTSESGRGAEEEEVEEEAREEQDGGIEIAELAVQRQIKEDKSIERRKELEARLVETNMQMQKLQSWSSSNIRGMTSGLAAKERERVGVYRQKTKAALVIQLAWRRYIRLKRHREAIEKSARSIHKGGLEWRRELAALIIQLAWRQYLRRKLLKRTLRRQKVLNDWSPSVMAARQKVLVEKVYGQEMQAVSYDSPKPRPMVRPAYLSFVPSPAALSFNFALQSYTAAAKNDCHYSMTDTV